MSTYQVFVERPSSPAPDALARLAAAIAKHYGIAAGDLEPRLRAGRFRVKANVDRETAEKFALDLEQLGAVVSVIDASGAVVSRAKKPAPAPRPATDSKAPVFASGLAAAFGAKSDEPDLGALGDTSGSFSLSSVDGSDEQAAVEPAGSFAPPSSSGHDLPASIGPAIAAPAPKAAKAATAPPPMGSGPIDMFAPPDSEEQLVDLAVDMADVKAKRAATHSTPPPTARSSARTTAQPPMAEMPSASPSAPQPSVAKEKLRAFAGHRRARFAAGAVLTVLVGFVPAHILASVRERSAYAEIDTHLAEKEAHVQSLEQWKTLDKIIEAHRDEKVAEQHSIALTAVILWALVSAGFAFVWFRKIDWDRIAAG